MSKFDNIVLKQNEQTQIRQELKKALKQVQYLINLSMRTGKAKQAKKVSYFLKDVELCNN